MAVYVDDVRHAFGRMVMCHMWASRIDDAGRYVEALDELLAMADAIGLARRWLQQPPKASWVHFDVSLGLKAMAIERGALLTDRYGPIEHSVRLGRPSPVTLDQIAATRAKLGLAADGIIRTTPPSAGRIHGPAAGGQPKGQAR